MNMLGSILKKKIALILGIALGIYLGVCHKGISGDLSVISDIYLSLISLTIIPITFTLLCYSMCSLSSHSSLPISAGYIWSFILVVLGIGTTIAVGMSSLWLHIHKVATNGAPFLPNISAQALSTMVSLSMNDTLSDINAIHLNTFLSSLVPKNIFNALSTGNGLQLFVLALLVGFSMSTRSEASRKSILNGLDVIRSIFTKILQTTLIFLPVGIVAIISTSLSSVNGETLLSMLQFICWLFFTFLLIISSIILILKFNKDISVLRLIYSIRNALFVAFTTGSNQAAVPIVLDELSSSKYFNFRRDQLETIFPLFTTVCRVNNAAYFSFTAMFIAAVYNVPLDWSHIIFVAVGGVFASLASAGANSLIGFSMITLILTPLGIPLGQVGAILLVIEPLVDPIRTVLSTLVVALLTSLVLEQNSQSVNV